jgi:chitodextrinase
MTRERFYALLRAIKSVRESIPDDIAYSVPDLYAAWKTDTAYAVGDRVLFDGKVYKCLQAHTSQETWTPTDAVSLWAEVLNPDPEVIPEWVQPESTNPYMKGDKVRHNGKVWVSDVDNNVWEPGVYGWSEVTT